MSTGLAFRVWLLLAILIVAGWAARASGGTIMALNAQDPYSFWLHGSGIMDLGTGTVQVNSSASPAAYFQGSFVTLIAGAVNVVGGYQVTGTPTLPSAINASQPSVSDPLAGLAEPVVPPFATYPSQPQITGVGDFSPGYYPNGLVTHSGDNIVLHPGVYILDNGF